MGAMFGTHSEYCDVHADGSMAIDLDVVARAAAWVKSTQDVSVQLHPAAC